MEMEKKIIKNKSIWCVYMLRCSDNTLYSGITTDIKRRVEEHNDDPRNHHAHIMFSTRTLEATGFGAKTRVLDDRKTGVEETELIREVWETLANDALRRGGCSGVSIDRR